MVFTHCQNCARPLTFKRATLGYCSVGCEHYDPDLRAWWRALGANIATAGMLHGAYLIGYADALEWALSFPTDPNVGDVV